MTARRIRLPLDLRPRPPCAPYHQFTGPMKSLRAKRNDRPAAVSNRASQEKSKMKSYLQDIKRYTGPDGGDRIKDLASSETAGMRAAVITIALEMFEARFAEPGLSYDHLRREMLRVFLTACKKDVDKYLDDLYAANDTRMNDPNEPDYTLTIVKQKDGYILHEAGKPVSKPFKTKPEAEGFREYFAGWHQPICCVCGSGISRPDDPWETLQASRRSCIYAHRSCEEKRQAAE
jgi:hypothetical protein